MRVIAEVGDQKYEFEMNESDTIYTLKEKIYNVSQFKPSGQKVSFRGGEIENETIMKEAGLFDGASVTVTTHEIKVIIMTLMGDAYELETDVTEKVLHIKEIYSEMTGLNVSFLDIFFRDTKLNDDSTLEESGVGDGDEITCLPRLSDLLTIF
jgi:hypothetical protein